MPEQSKTANSDGGMNFEQRDLARRVASKWREEAPATAEIIDALLAENDRLRTAEQIEPGTLWDFRVQAISQPSGKYLVRATGTRSGASIEREGIVPLWDLVRIIGEFGDDPTAQQVIDAMLTERTRDD